MFLIKSNRLFRPIVRTFSNQLVFDTGMSLLHDPMDPSAVALSSLMLGRSEENPERQRGQDRGYEGLPVHS